MTDKFIMESFWQQEDKTNCASVAVIKAAIIKFHINKVFKAQRENGDYIITLQNKKKLQLSGAEIEKINERNDMVFSRYADPKRKKICGN